ncbi:MAG: ABC transporter permease [Bacteroidales bacterium]|nr:ABC transporter permease [Bacteroidales bacterium]MBR6277539.1 ABC transporter permease [Bacteroidales bacterium]
MNIIKIWYDELRTVFHDMGIMLFVIILPLAYPLIYAYVYTPEVQREVPVVVVDDCKSALSREFLRRVDATPDVTVAGHCVNMADAYSALEQQSAYAIIHIDKDFETSLSKGKQTVVGLYCNMMSMVYYKCAVSACSNVSIAMNRKIKVANYMKPKTERESQIMQTPIDYKHTSLYNSQSGYAAFMIPPILMMIIQQSLFLGIGMSMGRSREQNGGFVIPMNRFYKNSVEIVLGKMLFYLMLYIIHAIYAFVVITKMFSLPQLGHYWDFMLFVIPYIIDCCFLGMVLSYMIYRREDCMLIFVFMSLPLYFMCGLSWPGSAIPDGIRYFSYLFPSTFGLNAYMRISGMGASISDVAFEMKGICIQICVYFTMACLIYTGKIRKILRKEV